MEERWDRESVEHATEILCRAFPGALFLTPYGKAKTRTATRTSTPGSGSTSPHSKVEKVEKGSALEWITG